MEEIMGYHHVGIYAVNREKAIDFYTKALGFELLFKVDNESDGILIGMLKKGNLMLELLQDPAGLDKVQSASGSDNHLALKVSDIKSAVKKLKDYGVDTFEERGIYHVPDFGGKGSDLYVCFFRGPNGERIELVQEMA